MGDATLVWLRRDLRLTDNPALDQAARRGGPVIAVYLHAPEETPQYPPGAASHWYLHHSLKALGPALAQAGIPLVLRRGPALATLRALIRATGAGAVYWNRLYEPDAVARDRTVKQALRTEGLDCRSFPTALLHEPWAVRNQADRPYRAFTPFWRACRRQPPPAAPLPAPDLRDRPVPAVEGLDLAALGLLPRTPWDTGLRNTWQAGESAALARLEAFAADRLARYAQDRDRPAEPGTSGLSPALHFGELSPRQVWWQVMAAREAGVPEDACETFLSELGWREFAHHLLWSHPDLGDAPVDDRFGAFPWRPDPGDGWLHAWQAGRTGIPLVDAGMHELWQTGWMHNRVRMVTGSFLVKHLRLPWQRGERWFRDTLVDWDAASNAMGWQWVAGCGADAAPYFRIFNPVRQGERFDPQGRYVRRWLPALANLPDKYIHAPWTAPEAVLRRAGVTLGSDYPCPLIDLRLGREQALSAFQAIKG
ncbi:cryptochrome/photolyase family protein [Alkalilimnicola ehrlichii MLHE-1]|uniref:Deoxyribodipyrimidine photo-lyase n=1 Tax=Alkalilimnicola ehrlichii (strain ATCC BAA-1101 / DSM 17681 / MLHE-1) TaxID=187272 RepID=Q0A6D9_ALKEH|nr:deoxyribodipyrimidine photo-lyase [Alkalilimnicola ehrlichii]ABI57598.1 deoxyribodipyrimidine photo-lyase type I [Alkalilimnicola ehrlichii MLHE-1]